MKVVISNPAGLPDEMSMREIYTEEGSYHAGELEILQEKVRSLENNLAHLIETLYMAGVIDNGVVSTIVAQITDCEVLEVRKGD